VPPVPYRELRGQQNGTDSASIRDQVMRARQIQRDRYGEASTLLNGSIGSAQLRKHCRIDEAGEAILKQALTELGLSARAHDKILRVARTIADLSAREAIQPDDLSEAIMYRRLDRQL
jgi:magnesium chelatase family protein